DPPRPPPGAAAAARSLPAARGPGPAAGPGRPRLTCASTAPAPRPCPRPASPDPTKGPGNCEPGALYRVVSMPSTTNPGAPRSSTESGSAHRVIRGIGSERGPDEYPAPGPSPLA